MVKSIRLRMQIWYALVLAAVIASFAAVVYLRAHQAVLQRADAQLLAATRYLEATLRSFPPHELDATLPPDPPPGTRSPPPPEPRRPPRDSQDRPVGPPNGPPNGPPPGPLGFLPPGLFGGDPPRPPEDRPANQRPPNHGPNDRPPNERPPNDSENNSPPGPENRPRPGEAGPNRPNPAGSLPREKDISVFYGELDLHDVRDPKYDDPIKPMYFVIWRNDGRVLKASDPDLEISKAKTPTDWTTISNELHFDFSGPDRRALVLGPRHSTILVGKPMQRELADLRWLTWQLVGAGGLVLVVGATGGWFISGRLIRPIQSIATTASEISATQLGRRIDATLIDDELVDLARVLNDMFARLEGSFDRQTRFTADASHELRTPLAVLHSHLELALSRPRSTEAYQETLKTCLTACGRMRALVDGLLMLARADAGKLDLQFKPLDVRAVARDVAGQFVHQAEEAGVALSLSVPPQPVRVAGDAMFLSRVPANLLANALRHTPKGGQVRVSLTTDEREAVLSVTDNGSGIPEADQSRVFERFFRADQARSRASGGCGLGLAICKSLVEAHGGRIDFTSRSGRGTSFNVHLPLAM